MYTSTNYRARITARYTLADLVTADLTMMSDAELHDVADRAAVNAAFRDEFGTVVAGRVNAERTARAAYAAQLDADIAAHGGDIVAALLARI